MKKNEEKSIADIYSSWADKYDIIAKIYTLVGHRMSRYRKRAVDSLGLTHSNTVVDLACGTGLNFPYLQKAIGPTGKIVGVDITNAMLEQAEKRVNMHGWRNVELVHGDICEYQFPEDTDGVLSTLALGYLPDFDGLIKRIYDALPNNGKFAELNFKEPNNRLIRQILLKVLRPFGNMEDYLDRRVWESVEKILMRLYFRNFILGLLILLQEKN